jgi:voltage-gated potassium channel
MNATGRPPGPARLAGDGVGSRRPRIYVLAGMRLPLTAFVRILRDREARGSPVLVVSLFLIGTAFYVIAEGWSVVDAFYFSTMTLATVGFGDLTPTSDVAKLFTAVYVLAGVGILVAFFSELARATLEVRDERVAAREASAAGRSAHGEDG